MREILYKDTVKSVREINSESVLGSVSDMFFLL